MRQLDFFNESNWLIQTAERPSRFKELKRSLSNGTSYPGFIGIFLDVMEVCNSINLAFLGGGSLQLCEIDIYTLPGESHFILNDCNNAML